MANKQMIFVEKGAVDAVMRVMVLLEEAGDADGALREMKHFLAALRAKVLVPLGDIVKKEAEASDVISWLVKSNPERFRSPITSCAVKPVTW
nr:hypothetical protein [Candidatus Sigynarchaeum springense]